MNLILELSAVLLSLLFLFFLVKEKKICWIFGIISSIISMILFLKIKLYAEFILYIYYVLIGCYGYWLWDHQDKCKQPVRVKPTSKFTYLGSLIGGILLSQVLARLLIQLTDADKPYLDAHTTIFSFIASYLEAHKILGAWIFWIIINGTTLVLYYSKDLYYYFFMTLIFFIFSFYGYYDWHKKLNLSKLIL